MKYFIKIIKVYCLYYTYAEMFRIKKVAVEWINLIIWQITAKAAQVSQCLLIITWIENQI
jgi:hypothetical protein